MPRSLKPSSNLAASTNVSYQLTAEVASSGLIGSIALEFCDNSPLEEIPCTAPAGFDASSAVLAAQSGATGFAIATTTLPNKLVLSRPPLSAGSGSQLSYEFGGIRNPDGAGAVFARLYTYPTSDASGPATDSGGMALMLTSGVEVQAEVPPFLLFCLGEHIAGFDCLTATEPFVDFGNLSAATTAAAQTQALLATNASDGYTLWATGTSFTSGNTVIPPMTGGTSQKGQGQFGINLRANTAPVVGQDASGPGSAGVSAPYNTPNHFRFATGEPLASAAAPDDFRKYTVSYIVNVPPEQPGGTYATTITYICLANF